jgi:spore germination protein GerM
MTVVALIALLILSGCGKPMSVQNPAEGKTGANTQGNTAQSIAIVVYYGDDQGTKLVQKQIHISPAKDSDRYLAALNALKKSPDSQSVALCAGFTFRSATLQGNVLTVDLSLADEGRWGSSGEQLTVQAIKQTLFQFKEVGSIELLQDGKPATSLMGHLTVPHPIVR